MIKRVISKTLDNYQTVSYEKIKSLIDKYDVISFDVFDTLIKRDVPSPMSVFELIEYNTGKTGFALKRLAAERKARENKGEVNLEEIYDCYEGMTSEEKKEWMAIEIQHEMNLCHINQKIASVYRYACEQKKSIFILSDMYLSKEVIGAILKNNGITSYHALLVSNEIRQRKSDGSMYEYCKKEYGCLRMLHIGDNFFSDYIMARRCGFQAIKIQTNTKWLGRKYSKGHDNRQRQFLEAFLSNRHDDSRSYYYTFGFERFGPLLYGFVDWLYHEMKKDDIHQALFLSRDGFIMKKAYEHLGYDRDIPCSYFEASRRSMRVPTYYAGSSQNCFDMLSMAHKEVTMKQILDFWGLRMEDYHEKAKKYGFEEDVLYDRNAIMENQQFIAFYNEIWPDIEKNSAEESDELQRYLDKYDFSQRTAIIDIGWRGTMQKNLIRSLKRWGIHSNVVGYYVGIKKQWRDDADYKDYSAKGYLFDLLNESKLRTTANSFTSIFEFLFLEQAGSVKCYKTQGDKTVAVRYPYEYEENGKLMSEIEAVQEIQEGALDFLSCFRESRAKGRVGNDPKVMFRYIYETGMSPTLQDVSKLGWFRFFDNGILRKLVDPSGIGNYIANPKRFIKDFINAYWQAAFLRQLFKIPLPYRRAYEIFMLN